MEINFENNYEITFLRYYDWIKNPITERSKRIIKTNQIARIAGLSCGILLIIIAIIARQLPYLAIGLIYSAYCVYALIFKTRKMAAAQYGAMLRRNKVSKWIRNIRFFDDSFTIRDNNSTIDYKYSDLCDFTENDEYYHLWVDDSFVVRVLKDGFVKGDKSAFKSFILKNFKIPEKV